MGERVRSGVQGLGRGGGGKGRLLGLGQLVGGEVMRQGGRRLRWNGRDRVRLGRLSGSRGRGPRKGARAKALIESTASPAAHRRPGPRAPDRLAPRGQGSVVPAPRRGQQVGGDRFGDQLVAEPDPVLAALSCEPPVGGLDQEPCSSPSAAPAEMSLSRPSPLRPPLAERGGRAGARRSNSAAIASSIGSVTDRRSGTGAAARGGIPESAARRGR